jgi:putative PD-(D/E)XK family protein DUF4420
MVRIDSASWRELEAERPGFGHLNAKRVNDQSAVVLAVDHDGRRHILLPVDSANDQLNDNRSRGLSITTRGLEVEAQPERFFIDLCCIDGAGHDAFDLLGNALINELEAGAPIIDAVKGTVARWRRFWGAAPPEGLSPEEVRGLFAELWFLLVWSLPHGDPVERWVGPTATRHDFQWPRWAIECKATTSVRGHIHRINGLDQLDPPLNGRLYLFSLRMREEPSASNSLITLVEAITHRLAANPVDLDLFETRLAAAGYSIVHSDRYREIRFRVVDERLYVVAHGFPRLSAASFVGGLPPAIERVEYEVNLEVCPELCLAKLPGDYDAALRWSDNQVGRAAGQEPPP